jgi:hypothetical protein
VVGFAALAAQPAVGTADLVDGMALLAEEARQAGAVRARALDAEGADGSQRPRPSPPLIRTVLNEAAFPAPAFSSIFKNAGPAASGPPVPWSRTHPR